MMQKVNRKKLIIWDNPLLRNWELLTMVLVIEQMFYIPILLGFSPSQEGLVEVLQYIVDISFILDFFLQFNVARLDPKGELMTDRRNIFLAYFKLWFWIDLAASIPFEWFINPAANGESSTNVGTVKLLKILRLPRMLRLLKMMRIMKTLKISPELQRFLKYSRHAHLFKLFRIIVIVFVAIHLVCCFWYAVSAPDYPDGRKARGWFQFECENIQW